MNKEEFKELADNSGLTKKELGKLFGVTRGTIHNWLVGKNIPETKIDFIREILSKSPEEIRRLSIHKDVYTVEDVEPFVVKNFDKFMAMEGFRQKVAVEAYQIATEIVNKKKLE